MQANSRCWPVSFIKKNRPVRPFPDEKKKKEYLREVLKLLYDHGQTGSAPWLSMKIGEIYDRYLKKRPITPRSNKNTTSTCSPRRRL